MFTQISDITDGNSQIVVQSLKSGGRMSNTTTVTREQVENLIKRVNEIENVRSAPL